MSVRIIKTDDPLNDPAVADVRDVLRRGALTSGSGAQIDVPGAVAEIIRDVQQRGDQALIDLTGRLEGVELTPETIRVSASDIASALASAEAEFMALVGRAAANVRQYQQSILHESPPPLKRSGRLLAVRYTPIDRVGVYIPGGSGTGAVLVSSMLMTLVPAQVAGVGQIALVSPPTTNGDISPLVLAVAGQLGLDEVYRLSGTPGLAALGIGTESVPPVDKIVGPGNAFIAEAKRQLFGRVGIDSIAGPSEVLIVADQSADARWVAADMLAQAEHDPGSAVLVTHSAKLAEEVKLAVEMQIVTLDRLEALRAALERYSAIIVVPDLAAACDVANDFATEHLQIITEDDDAAMAMIRHAGAIFVGPHTPVPLGDYYAGPSHVLPTGGTAKFFGPLSCNDFLKASSVLRYDAAALAEDADDVKAFAAREGLTAHAHAIDIRLHPDDGA